MDDDQPSRAGPDNIPFLEHAKRLRHRLPSSADRGREVALRQSRADCHASGSRHSLPGSQLDQEAGKPLQDSRRGQYPSLGVGSHLDASA